MHNTLATKIGPRGQGPVRQTGPTGFTIIELLVVIGIIGALVALLIPAVQAAREAARRSSCANNLRQIGTGVLVHEETHGFMPTGGWGPEWIGDPDGGYEERQPGGWIYNILSFLEESRLRDIGKGQGEVQKRRALAEVAGSPIGLFHCPSRRSPRPYPFTTSVTMQNVSPPGAVAKTDYAVNGEIAPRRDTIILTDRNHAGSKTVLAGEKSLPDAEYITGNAEGDQLIMYVGDSADVRREVSEPPAPDSSGNSSSFGSAHSGGCQFVFADGSVRLVAFDEQVMRP